MREQFGPGAAAKLFEFFRQLTSDTNLAIRHQLGAERERFGQAIG